LGFYFIFLILGIRTNDSGIYLRRKRSYFKPIKSGVEDFRATQMLIFFEEGWIETIRA